MLRQLVLILVATVAVAGCTTTTTGGGPAADPKEAVRTRVAAGLQYLQMGDPSEARRHFSRALSIDDDSAAAHNAMALLYNYERDAEKEEYHYRKALSADRNYAPALNNYGTLLYTQRRVALPHVAEGAGPARRRQGRVHPCPAPQRPLHPRHPATGQALS